MVQKKRHFIHGKSMVEVIYRKAGKPSRGLNEPSSSGDESNPVSDSAEHGNTRFTQKDKKLGVEFST